MSSDDIAKGPGLLPFFMVFGGCMSAIIAMEYMLKVDPKSGNLLTLCEFAFVLIPSLPGRIERQESGGYQFQSLRVPLMSHVQHAALWVSMSVLTNYVFAFNISVPIHTLFRSCNVIASVLLGYFLFGQNYSRSQLVCVVVITVGIFLGSIGDAKKFTSGGCKDCGTAPGVTEENGDSGLLVWFCGIGMLVIVQFLQGLLGHCQAIFYKCYADRGPKNELAEEFLFTSHAVSFLPLLFLWRDIAAAAEFALYSPPLSPLLPLPSGVVWLILNNIFQLACIKGVFRLAAHYSPLTVNITLSVRKFLSVVVSIIWFGNPWTHLHSVAVVAIFGGVFAYSQCQAPPLQPPAKKEQ